VAFATAATVIAVYWRAVFDDFLLSDDYAWLWKVMRHEALGRQMLLQGRFVYAWLLRTVFPFAPDASQLWRIRAIGLLFTLATAMAITGFCRRRGLSRIESAALAFLICTLPCCQVSVFFATAFIYPLGALLAVVAAELVERGCSAHPGGKRAVWTLAAWLTLSIAMFVYQSAAMAFVAFVTLAILVTEDAATPRRCLLGAIALAGACGVAWAAVRGIGWLYPGERTNRSALLTDAFEKLAWFFREPLVAALDLHRLRPSVPLALVAAAVMAVGLTLHLHGRKHACRLGLVCIVAVPLSYLPNLVVAEDWFSYRTLIGTSALCVVLLVVAGRGWARLTSTRTPHRVALCAWVGLVALWVPLQLDRYVLQPQHAEWAALKAGARQALGSPSPAACLKPARAEQTLAPMYRTDEFGRPSSAAEWARETAFDVALWTVAPGLTLPAVHVDHCLPDDSPVIDLNRLHLALSSP
jgi:hypothetical protein